jgi:hypothetical protein
MPRQIVRAISMMDISEKKYFCQKAFQTLYFIIFFKLEITRHKDLNWNRQVS